MPETVSINPDSEKQFVVRNLDVEGLTPKEQALQDKIAAKPVYDFSLPYANSRNIPMEQPNVDDDETRQAYTEELLTGAKVIE